MEGRYVPVEEWGLFRGLPANIGDTWGVYVDKAHYDDLFALSVVVQVKLLMYEAFVQSNPTKDKQAYYVYAARRGMLSKSPNQDIYFFQIQHRDTDHPENKIHMLADIYANIHPSPIHERIETFDGITGERGLTLDGSYCRPLDRVW